MAYVRSLLNIKQTELLSQATSLCSEDISLNVHIPLAFKGT